MEPIMAEAYIFAGVAGYVGRPDATGAVGVFRRAAKDGEWSHVFGDHPAHTVYVHPDDPSIVYAGTTNGVWCSTDSGATFQKADFPDADKQIWSFLAIDGHPDRIYAGGAPIDVYRSDDRGATWAKLPNPGMPMRCKGPFEPRVMRMAQRPGRPDEIYAACEIAGTMHTTDGGQTWTDTSDHMVELSKLPHLQSQIVQKETWAEGMLDCHAVAIAPAKPDEPIVALRKGLFKTDNAGKTWNDMEVGRYSPTTYGRDIKASPHDPATLFAALSVSAASHDGGVYKSTDAGETWARFDKVQVHGTIMNIGLSKSLPDQVVIGARYGGEVFMTQDGGDSWSEIRLPGDVQDIYAIACS
jgi:photosystem II stability/assembly factor-like uncharacterized protein